MHTQVVNLQFFYLSVIILHLYRPRYPINYLKKNASQNCFSFCAKIKTYQGYPNFFKFSSQNLFRMNWHFKYDILSISITIYQRITNYKILKSYCIIIIYSTSLIEWNWDYEIRYLIRSSSYVNKNRFSNLSCSITFYNVCVIHENEFLAIIECYYPISSSS